MAGKKRQKRRIIKTTDPCAFCVKETIPSYKNYENLAKFINERGKIISTLRTGVCAKHQRLLAKSIKRARHLGLLSYANSV